MVEKVEIVILMILNISPSNDAVDAVEKSRHSTIIS
jgi:hypothetical protein